MANTWVDASGGFPDPTSATAFYAAMNHIEQGLANAGGSLVQDNGQGGGTVQAASPSGDAYQAQNWVPPTAGTPVTAEWMNDLEGRAMGTGTGFGLVVPTGAAGDGTTDDTAALRTWAAACAGKAGLLPAATYRVTGTITFPASASISGYGAVLKATTGGVFNIVAVSNGVRLSGLEITSTRGTGAVTGGHGISAPNTTGVRIVDCNVHAINYHGIDFTNSTGFVVATTEVSDCYQQGIYIDHSTWGRILGCNIFNTQHGIQWWGGDSGNSTDYAAGPQVKHLAIVGNTIRDGNAAVSAGIWGSLGQYITITGNTVENMTDLAIDLEGTFDSTVTGNEVNEGKNGCFSVVNGSRRVTFTGNVGTNVTWGGAAFRADWGSGVTWASQDITITGNQFSSPLAVFTMASGSIQESVFNENHVLVRSQSDPSGALIFVNANEMTISHNRIYLAVGGTGIKVFGGGNCEIVDNKIVTFSDPSSSSAQSGGILIQYADSTWTAQYNRVKDNTVRNFVKAIYDNCGTSPAYTLIEGNRATTIAHNGSTGYFGLITGNRSETNPTVTSTVTVL